MHLTTQLYFDALRGRVPTTAVVRQGHAHLLEVCAVCASEWQGGEGGRPFPLRFVDAGEEPPVDDVPEEWLLTQAEVDRRKDLRSRRREAAARAREDLKRLLRQPPDTWEARVAGARTRFRSRAFAESLVTESRARVRDQPALAAALARLVPTVLDRAKGRPDLPWVGPLLVYAEAHHANALRVAGELPAAAGLYQRLRRTMVREPVESPALEAEIDSLEASLAIDRGAFAEAEGLLRRAAEHYRRDGDREGEARSLIQLANLLGSMGRPADSLDHFSRAAELVDVEAAPDLFIAIVTGWINVLCDLDQAGEAERLLATHASLFLHADDRFTVLIHGYLKGRVALGLDRPEEAVDRLHATYQTFLDMGRDYDAILSALYLADALFAANRMSELRTLAADLVPLFRSRGVARETLATLHLLARAAAAERLDAALLDKVRRRVEEAATPLTEPPVPGRLGHPGQLDVAAGRIEEP